MDSVLSGIVHNGGQQSGVLLSLPLEEVKVHARVIDSEYTVLILYVGYT
jgi:hypothetical protein